MLTKVIIENFKSFDDRNELNMISSSKIRTNTDHRVSIGSSIKLLKYAAVYGGNASGKSNLIDVMIFFRQVLESGLPVWSTKYFCRNKEENKTRDSIFEIQMEIGDRFYSYGFSALLAERRITGEWLYELYQNGSFKCVFERENDGRIIMGDGLNFSSEDKNRFDMYAADFEGNITDLFLNEMNRGKRISENSKLLVFNIVCNWITSNIVIITPKSKLSDFRYYYEAGTMDKINSLISTFDTGISSVRIEEIDIEELSSKLPNSVFTEVIRKIRKGVEEGGHKSFRLSGRSDTVFFNVEYNGSGEPGITTIKLKHGKSLFDFEDESDGTRRLFDLMDMLLCKDDDVVYFVDELERSLHPKLTEHFMKLFNESHKDRKAQMIFTTHEASIMDQELFRRDEIWFIERDADNNSHIYSLDRFKERYDKKLSKAYLDGRYGAVPVFREFDFEKGE